MAVPSSYCVVVVVVFPLDGGGTGGVSVSYSLVVVVSVTWWVVEQPTRHKSAKPVQPAMAALIARFMDMYSYSISSIAKYVSSSLAL
jgi:hypothetical protein